MNTIGAWITVLCVIATVLLQTEIVSADVSELVGYDYAKPKVLSTPAPKYLPAADPITQPPTTLAKLLTTKTTTPKPTTPKPTTPKPTTPKPTTRKPTTTTTRATTKISTPASTYLPVKIELSDEAITPPPKTAPPTKPAPPTKTAPPRVTPAKPFVGPKYLPSKKPVTQKYISKERTYTYGRVTYSPYTYRHIDGTPGTYTERSTTTVVTTTTPQYSDKIPVNSVVYNK